MNKEGKNDFVDEIALKKLDKEIKAAGGGSLDRLIDNCIESWVRNNPKKESSEVKIVDLEEFRHLKTRK